MSKLFQIDVHKIEETQEWGAVVCHVPSQTVKDIKTDMPLRKLLNAVRDAVIEKEKESRYVPENIIQLPNNGDSKIVVPVSNRID